METTKSNEGKTETPVGKRPDTPKSGMAAGVLMLLAGPCSLGLTTTDPTNPSGLAMLTLIFALAAAAYSFTKKRKNALVWTWIVVVITGIFAFTGLAVHPVAFLIRGGIGCVLAICALFGLRKAPYSSPASASDSSSSATLASDDDMTAVVTCSQCGKSVSRADAIRVDDKLVCLNCYI